ncbi:MAG: DUF2844 domain-containing protein [Terriglobales bacterium]
MRRFYAVPLFAAVAMLALAATPPQLPVLGQPLPAAAQALTGSRQLLQSNAAVHQYLTPRGVTLRAYTAANGTVFGLAWQGITSPDLASLLGTRYAAYHAALAAHPHRGPISIEAGDLVVQLGGHMRDLRGRAYLIHAIPAQLSAQVVR